MRLRDVVVNRPLTRRRARLSLRNLRWPRYGYVLRRRYRLAEEEPSIDQATRELVRSLQPSALRDAEMVFRRYYENWKGLSSFHDFAIGPRGEFTAFQSRYFGEILDGEMGERYVALLWKRRRGEMKVGLRPRASTSPCGIHLAAHLFAELGRRHRWSGPRTAEACQQLMRYVAVDALNAMR